MNMQVDTHMVRELAIFAENDGDLYARRIMPVVHCLAKHQARGNYAPELAVRAFTNIVPDVVHNYRVQVLAVGEAAPKLNREEKQALARAMLESHEERITEEAAQLLEDKRLRAVWTMAAIKDAVSRTKENAHFFERKTLRFFGETMRDYRRHVEGGKITVERLSSKAGRKLYSFDPKTHALEEIRAD